MKRPLQPCKAGLERLFEAAMESLYQGATLGMVGCGSDVVHTKTLQCL
jgi:hypothetical protein